MASPNSSYNELLSLTVQELEDEFFDQISATNAITALLKEKGMVRGQDGGPTIVVPIEYAENGSYHRYSGAQTLNTSSNDIATAFSASWCQVALNVQAHGREILQNSGSSQHRDLVKTRIQNAKTTFENNFNEDLLSDGSLSNQVTGLAAHISDNGTGTIQGVARATYSFAANQFYRATTDGGAAMSATNIVGYMDTLDLYIRRYRGKTAAILSDDVTFRYYESAVHPLQRITNEKGALGRMGFGGYMYKNAELVFEPSIAGMPSTTQYWLDPEVLELVHHTKRNLVRLGERQSFNQDAQIEYLAWMGNLVAKNYRRLGVLNND